MAIKKFGNRVAEACFAGAANIGFLYLSSAVVFHPDGYRETDVRTESTLNSSLSP